MTRVEKKLKNTLESLKRAKKYMKIQTLVRTKNRHNFFLILFDCIFYKKCKLFD